MDGMIKKLFIGYISSDRQKTKPLNYLIKEAALPEEKKQIVKLYMDSYGEVDFLEEDTWYDVRKMNHLIAVDKGKLLGCATWEKQKDKLFLLAILTMPEYFRRGVATKLLNSIKIMAKEAKWPKIFVPVSNDDLVSYAFYLKNGFKLTGVDISLPEKRHGKEEAGFWGLPCRDEFYLEYKI